MEVLRPRSLDEALRLRRDWPDALPVAGGTDVMVEVNAQAIAPARFLDLSRVDELASWHRNGVVHVGARLTFARVLRELRELEALAAAADSVASPQIRNRATIGGNLGTASPAGDSLAVFAAYGADVVAASADSMRRIPLAEFLVGPKRTALACDELIVGVEWQPVDGPSAFAKIGRRNAMVIAVASVCLQLDRARRQVRLALGSVAPTVLRARHAEEFASAELDWTRASPAALAEFGRLAAADSSPIDDRRGTARYRRHAVGVLAQRALAGALEAPW